MVLEISSLAPYESKLSPVGLLENIRNAMRNSFSDQKREEVIKYFDEAKIREGGSLDKFIFVSATGTLVLSINYIVGLGNAFLYYPVLLILAWALLLLSIVAHGFSYRASVKYHQAIVDHLNRNLREPKVIDRQKKWVDRLNDISFYSLILGLLSLTLFASVNFIFRNKQSGKSGSLDREYTTQFETSPFPLA